MADIHQEPIIATPKKIANLITLDHRGILGFWFKIFSSIHNR